MRLIQNNAGGVQSLSFRNNSLNTVRLLAALQVFYGHAVVHMKLPSNAIISSVFSIFQGVPIFFIMSGFLIWNSLDRTPDLKSYLKKRVLRLYPELWCAVLLSVLSIVVLYDGFRIGELILFTLGQATLLQFWTPNSLRGFGCGTPNGCLASIFMIVQFYIVVWPLKRKIKPGKTMWGILLTLGLALNMLSPVFSKILPSLVYKLWDISLLPYFWLFILGAFVSEYFEKFVPIMKKYWFIGLVLLLLQTVVHIDIPGEYGVIKSLLQCFTWIGFAYALPNMNIKRDISYGIFLYHMVVINAFIQLGYVGSWIYLEVVMVIVISIAILSNALCRNSNALNKLQ